MSDVLDGTGLTLKSLPDITTEITDGMKGIYGADISVEADTPDGQAINIFAQEAIDLREVLQDIYTGFDPDQAQGTVLDQRVAFNGIQRAGGTFTVTPVDITVDRSVTLVGLDTESENINIPEGVYTIKDDAGTQFVLIDSVTITTGLHSLPFRAAAIGETLVTIGTITTAVTAIAGITAINNSESVTTQGVNEETDAALRLRRRRSTAISSQGYTDSIEAVILSLDGVTACIVDENVTDTIDIQGIPPHSIWVIVEGGTDSDIANAIYATKSAGCGMFGSESVTVTRTNGRTMVINFDRTSTEYLYVRFNIVVIGGGVVDTDNLKVLIVENVSFEIGEDASADVITCYVKTLNSNYRVTGMELSKDNMTWGEVVTTTAIANKFEMAVARITIS